MQKKELEEMKIRRSTAASRLRFLSKFPNPSLHTKQ